MPIADLISRRPVNSDARRLLQMKTLVLVLLIIFAGGCNSQRSPSLVQDSRPSNESMSTPETNAAISPDIIR